MPTHDRQRGLAMLLALATLIAGCGDESPPAAGPSAGEPFTTKTGIEMVRIPAGRFVMGSADGEADETPPHEVHVGAFLMDTCEVTQASYQALMGRNPSKARDGGGARPVEQVDWLAAVTYCNMRSVREGLTPCYNLQTLACNFEADGYRLPTEAEWEYACRAGSTAAYAFGAGAARLGDYAWFSDNAGKTTHSVGRKRPNAWGLYDMHGNVAEWCHDVYGETAYGQHASRNPRGPAEGDERVLRGGSWRTSADACRAAARYSETPRFADACFGSDAYGFRCVRRAPPFPDGG
jgi:formylglycine-generating enzyme required for sulfatase activity